MMSDEYNEAFNITEEEKQGLQPFTLEDALEDEANTDVCLLCMRKETCPIAIYVNKLSMKRDNKMAEEEFGCTLFKGEEDETPVEEV